jgi:hypothetical protein
VDDSAAACVNPVVGEAQARGDEVRSLRGLFAFGKRSIGPQTAEQLSVRLRAGSVLPKVHLAIPTQTRARHHRSWIEAARFTSKPDAVAMSETFERNVFHLSPPTALREGGIVNVVAVANGLKCIVGDDGWLTSLGIAYIIIRPPDHGDRR